MKVILVVLIAFFAIVNCGTIDEVKAKAKSITKECAKEHNIANEDIKKFYKHELFSSLTETEDIKCFARCLLTKSAYIKDKQIDVERIVASSVAFGKDEKKTRVSVERCKVNYKGEDTCEEAWAINKCYHRA